MKTLANKKSKFVIFLMLTALLFLCMGAFGVIGNAKAEEVATKDKATVEYFLPQTNLEYKALSSPIDVYHDETVTAIIENSSLLVYKDGKYQNSVSNINSMKQVKRADKNTLWVSNGNILPISLNDLSKGEALKDTDNDLITCNYFDINDNYLITAYSQKATLYKRENDTFREIDNFTIKDNAPVAINSANVIFYSNNGKLHMRSADNSSKDQDISPIIPEKMIAGKDHLYFIHTNNIYHCNFNDANPATTVMSVIGDENFELGNLIEPSGLFFKGDNLLVADSSNNCVQEFKVDGDTLTFTGFAIAEGKTAYNRINKSAVDVEKNGQTIAILDNYKFSIIKDGEDRYSSENFKNYFKKETFNDLMPTGFALGENSALFYYFNNVDDEIKLFDVETGEFIAEKTVQNGDIIKDVCYQSGYYYILTYGAKNLANVYKIDQTEINFDNPVIQVKDAVAMSSLTVDVFGNVYLADETSNNSKIYKYLKSDNYQTRTDVATTSNIKKLATDLGGVLFVLDNSGLKYLKETETDGSIKYELASISLSAPSSAAKSFAMDFDSNDVFFIYDSQEYVGISSTISNLAISSLKIPTEYITTAANADITSFKTYKAIDGANVYLVDKNVEQFKFVELVPADKEYVYICDVSTNNAYGKAVTFYALAGQDEVVLINSLEVTETTPTLETAPQSAFVATGVNMYYMPLITKNGEYSLTDTEVVRLSKTTKISPVNKFTFLNREFYFVCAVIGEKTYNGYVPTAFTVEILSEDFKWNEYTIARVKETVLYQEQALTTSIMTLNQNTSVRILEQNGEVLKVAVKTNDGWINGYIDANRLKDDAAVAIRNALILIVVTACACATTTYFVLKKKN